jgi:hypothetical protein
MEGRTRPACEESPLLSLVMNSELKMKSTKGKNGMETEKTHQGM